MNARVKLITTVGVLWLVALGVVALQTLNTDEMKQIRIEATAETRRDCIARGEALDLSPAMTDFATAKCGEDQTKSVSDYDGAGAAVRVAAASLIALAIVAAVVIWTRSAEDELADPSVRDAGIGPPDPFAEALPNETPEAIRTATVAGQRSAVVESLRQLKALHEEDILTDDEYETKRQELIAGL